MRESPEAGDAELGDVVEENRRLLPENSPPDDVVHLVDEIDRRLSELKSRNGKQLLYRAMLFRALQDWREFGVLVFAGWWLV